MPDPNSAGPRLTPRERDVLQHAAFGLTNRAIGLALGIAEQTVKNHIASAMRKLALHDRTHAVVVAIGEGLIKLPITGAASSWEMDVAGHGQARDDAPGPDSER